MCPPRRRGERHPEHEDADAHARPKRSGTKANARAKQRAKRGPAFLFALSESAQVAIAIEREGRCKTTRCRGVLSAALTAGANRVTFGGRFGKTRLKPGKDQATVVATDAAGQ